MEEYAAENDLLYINFLELVDEAGLDFTLSGAEKLSYYFGKVLSEEVGLQNRRGEAHLEELWTEKIEAYKEEMEKQYAELQQ